MLPGLSSPNMSDVRRFHIENPHRNHRFWHKVQVHCHSQDSDGKRGQTPMIVEEAYREAGYTCVFLTDHNKTTPDPGVSGILHINGAEYGKGRHHTLALGVDRTASDPHRQDRAGTGNGAVHPDENGLTATCGCSCGNISKRLAHITGVDKAIPAAAHPNARHFCSGPLHPLWCGGGWSPNDLTSHAGQYAGMEIFNANNAASRMWSLDRWDEVLAVGARKTWAFASDDCHDVHDPRTFDCGWIQVNSQIDPLEWRRGHVDPTILQWDILDNIRNGNFWAVVRSHAKRNGKRLASGSQDKWLSPAVSHSQSRISVVADRLCKTIEFRAGSSSRRGFSVASESATFAYELGGWEDYVRIRIAFKGDNGRSHDAFSQPLAIRHD
jgi:hypothetical protein